METDFGIDVDNEGRFPPIYIANLAQGPFQLLDLTFEDSSDADHISIMHHNRSVTNHDINHSTNHSTDWKIITLSVVW